MKQKKNLIKTLIKNLFVVIILLAGMNVGKVNAQEQEKNKLAIGAQTAFTSERTGVGARFGYNFTDILRFTFEGNYYLSAKETYGVFNDEKQIGNVMDGRLWDMGLNLNFVFGEKSFHFYLIGGIGFAYGYKLSTLIEEFSNDLGNHYDVNGNYLGYGIHKDNLSKKQRIGVSLNSGFGVEWQITSSIRWNLENTFELALPSLSAWRIKTGIAYCF